MYYIEKIYLTGKGVEESGVDLTPGLNIIYGPSETGKSYIVKCIKYMYGKKDSEIDKTLGFDTVHMTLVIDGDRLNLTRRLDEEKTTVSGNIEWIENGEYSLSSGKNRIGDLWLSLMGIKAPTQIIKKNDYSSERLNYASLMHLFLVDEDTISKTDSILMPSQYSKWPKTKAAILYLMQGDNFLKGHENKETDNAKIQRKAIETYINERLIALSKKKQNIKEKSKGQTAEEIQYKINEVLKAIDSAESELTVTIDRIEELAAELLGIDERLVESNALSNRYRSLRSQYRSDIRRLTFVAEGDMEMERISRPVSCPYCGGEVAEDRKQSYVETAKEEVEKLVPKISDLQDAQDELKEIIKRLEERREEAIAEKTTLEQQVKKQMRPSISELQEHLNEYRQAIESYKEEQVYSDLEWDMQEELKKSAMEDGLEETFDFDEHFTAEILDMLNRIIEGLLIECCYDKYGSSSFSMGSFDVSVNDHSKKTFGAGYRAFVNSILILALQGYLKRYGNYSSDVIVLDSPILSLKEQDSVKASAGMQAGLFRYLAAHQAEQQTIVVENQLPEIDYTGVNMIPFTREDDGKSRYGFLKGVK